MNKNTEHKSMTVRCEIKGVNDKGEFEGYGSVFGNIDLGYDVVEKGAFADSLKVYKEKGQMPALLWSHDVKQPIGEWLEMSEDEHGLKVKGVLWVKGNTLGREPIAEAEQARNMMMSNGPKGLSIGYWTVDAAFEKRDDEHVTVLKTLALMEVSPVVFAMNPEASVTGAKSIDTDNIREVEHGLKSLGFSAKEAKTIISEGYKALSRDGAASDRDDLTELMASQKKQNDLLKGESK